ncbi:MAG: hypothetical protein AB1750_07195 [Chloroflexota bacterium]
MTDEKTFTESEAHLYFAKRYNGMTWEALDKKNRTPEENELLLDYAHASLAHWRAAGKGVNHQRGEWLIARAWIAIGDGEQALRHARRTAELTEAHRAEVSDFDFAFAHEGLARALAMVGQAEEARKFIALAQEAGEKIADAEDRQIFFDDFNSGNWSGLK